MKQSYLFKDRDATIPVPKKNPGWEKVTSENVTVQTREMLSSLQEYFPHVSVFSWHPHIPTAQYSDQPDSWGSNYNARLSIGSSITIRSFPGTKSAVAVVNGFDSIENSLKHIPEIQTLGGNGTNDEDTKTYRSQVSFLKTVGTSEEADKIQERVMTSGAYSFMKGEWYYIPAEKFSP